MNNLQIIVTGPFKEKAMLTSIIADKLKVGFQGLRFAL